MTDATAAAPYDPVRQITRTVTRTVMATGALILALARAGATGVANSARSAAAATRIGRPPLTDRLSGAGVKDLPTETGFQG
ncbi:hypothetical protein [Mycobacterium simiae]|uniref:hypothetical protein n=1 Tax=Mycobacterium simiae TaxID=1784 RepID=UPI00260E53E9|nr:hypothetical protein [Mycobacterium simiae]